MVIFLTSPSPDFWSYFWQALTAIGTIFATFVAVILGVNSIKKAKPNIRVDLTEETTSAATFYNTKGSKKDVLTIVVTNIGSAYDTRNVVLENISFLAGGKKTAIDRVILGKFDFLSSHNESISYPIKLECGNFLKINIPFGNDIKENYSSLYKKYFADIEIKEDNVFVVVNVVGIKPIKKQVPPSFIKRIQEYN